MEVHPRKKKGEKGERQSILADNGGGTPGGSCCRPAQQYPEVPPGHVSRMYDGPAAAGFGLVRPDNKAGVTEASSSDDFGF